MHKFNIEKLKETVIQYPSFKTSKRTLWIGKGQKLVMRKPDEKITHDRKQLVKDIGDFYIELYSGSNIPRTNVNIQNRNVTDATVDKIKEALKI